MNIAVIGLGKIGTSFLRNMIMQKDKGVNVLAVSEEAETPGREAAQKENIPVMSIHEIGNLADKIDIIFDLSGNIETRKILNSFHESQSNKHTVIVRENVVFLFWAIIEGKTVPEVVRDRN
ncbi:MAG: Gfo/Idh/MocA family oxidoreductase [Spirochaetia bacterium]|nr:Gfo/Idh/MocA family oxidoreductase [Spirochaetia bacterium]